MDIKKLAVVGALFNSEIEQTKAEATYAYNKRVYDLLTSTDHFLVSATEETLTLAQELTNFGRDRNFVETVEILHQHYSDLFKNLQQSLRYPCDVFYNFVKSEYETSRRTFEEMQKTSKIEVNLKAKENLSIAVVIRDDKNNEHVVPIKIGQSEKGKIIVSTGNAQKVSSGSVPQTSRRNQGIER